MSEILPTSLQLDIVTPDRMVVHDSVGVVTIPGKEGYLGILPGHAPLLTELAPGRLVHSTGSEQHAVAVDWGFAEVLPERVIVLVQSAERAEEIDVTRAERAKQRAEERLKRFSDPEVDRERARAALLRALARLETAPHARG